MFADARIEMLTRFSQSSSSRFGLFGCIVVLKRNGEDGSVFKINYETVRIGKNDATLDIRVQNDAVSPIHCLLEVNQDTKKILCRSCNPENPAVVNGEFISVQGKILSSGDIIRIGTRNFRFEYNINWTQGLGKTRRSRSLGRSQGSLDTEQQNNFSQQPSVATSQADLNKSEAVTSSIIKQPKISTATEENTANDLIVKPKSVEQSPFVSMEKTPVETSNEKLRRNRSKETLATRQSSPLKMEKITSEKVESTNLDSVFAESIDMLEKNLAKVVNRRKSTIAARELKEATQKSMSRYRLSLPVITVAKNWPDDNNKQCSKANRKMSIKRNRVSLSMKNSGGSLEERVGTKEVDLCTSTVVEEVMKQDEMEEPRSVEKEIETTKINESFTSTMDLFGNRKRSLSSKKVSRYSEVSGKEIKKSSDVESGRRLSRRSLKESSGNSEPTTEISPLNSERRPPSVVDTNAIANNSINLLDIDQNKPLDNQDHTNAWRSSQRIAKKTSSSLSPQDHVLNSSIEPLNFDQSDNQLMDSQYPIYDKRLSRGSISNRLCFRDSVAEEDDFVTDGSESLYLPVSSQDPVAAILRSSSEAEASPSKRRASSNRSSGRRLISELSPKNSEAENASAKESTFLAEDISVLESQDLQNNFELQSLKNQTFSTEDVSMISFLDSCSSSNLTVKDKASTRRLTLGNKEVVVAPADSTTPRPSRASLIAGTKPDKISGTKPNKISFGQASVMRHLRSPPASLAPGITPGLSRVQTRRSVSFGPQLSPEYVDSRLPPSTPVKRGTKPTHLSMTQPRLSKRRVDDIPSSLFKMKDNKPLPIFKKKVLQNVTKGSINEKSKSSVGGKKLFSEVLKAAKTPKVKRLQHMTPVKFYNKTDKPKKKAVLHDERKVVNLGNVTPRYKPATTGHANSPITYVIGKKRASSGENLRLESSKKQKRGSSSRLESEDKQSLARKGTPKADSQNVQGIKELTHLPKDPDYSQAPGVRSTTRKCTPKADYRNIKGLKRLLHPPKSPDYSKVEGARSVLRQRTPKADYRNVKGLKELMNPPKSPDYSKVEGVRSVLRQRTPKADYRNVKGLKELMNPPKSPDYSKVEGVRSVLRQRSPKADYRNVKGLKELMNPPKSPNYSKVEGVRSVLRQRTPKADYRNVKGLKELVHPPQSPDYSKAEGIRSVLRQHTPKANYKNVKGLKELMHPPKESNLEDISAVKRFIRGSTPRGNYQDLEGIKELMQSPMLKQPKPRNLPDVGSSNDEENELDSYIRHITSARVQLEPLKVTEETTTSKKDIEIPGVSSKRIMRNEPEDSEKDDIASGTGVTAAPKLEAKKPRGRPAKVRENHDLSTKDQVSYGERSRKETRSNKNVQLETKEKEVSTRKSLDLDVVPIQSKKTAGAKIDNLGKRKVVEEIEAADTAKEEVTVQSKRMMRNKHDDLEEKEIASSAKTKATSKRQAKTTRITSAKAAEGHLASSKEEVSPAKPSLRKTRSKKALESEKKEKKVLTNIEEEMEATNKGKKVRNVPSNKMTRAKTDESKKEEVPRGTLTPTTPKLGAKRSHGQLAKPSQDHAVSTKNPVVPGKPSLMKTRSNKGMQSKPKEKKVSTRRPLNLDVVSTQGEKTVRIQVDNSLAKSTVSEEITVTNRKKEIPIAQNKRVMRNKPDNLKKTNTKNEVETMATSKVQAETASGRKGKELDPDDVSPKGEVSPAKPSSKKTRNKKGLRSEPKKKESPKQSTKEKRRATPPKRALRTRR
ncbi:proliferation marker protein Ki-67-like isoform X1 [Artemia franciscana]|uniref:proliferation marker protein Ki-67-like isoform X1 n=2 Tax=Artemia franciscana TaxID=6661 RepID=UPI0032DA65DC